MPHSLLCGGSLIDGSLKCCGSNRKDFLEKVRKIYPNNELFVAKVTREKEIIDIPGF